MGNLLFDGAAEQLESSIEDAAERTRAEPELHLDAFVVGAVDVAKGQGEPVFLGEGLEDRADLLAGVGQAGLVGRGRRGVLEGSRAVPRGRRAPPGSREEV